MSSSFEDVFEGTPLVDSRRRPGHVIKDHFTLDAPTSTVNFRSCDVRIHNQASKQIQIVESRDETILKTAEDGSFGEKALRLWYSLLAFLTVGAIFIFCIQVFLVIFLPLALALVHSSDFKLNFCSFCGTLFSMPLWIYGLGSAMTIGTTFVLDTWNGNRFANTFVPYGSVWLQWTTFFIFLGMPLLAAVFAMSSQIDGTWGVISRTWFYSISSFYVVYVIGGVFYEIRGFFEIMHHHELSVRDDHFLTRIKNAILAQQRMRYCGIQKNMKVVLELDKMSHDDCDERGELVGKSSSLYSRFTTSNFAISSGMFEKLAEPKRLFTSKEIRGVSVFVTSTTWNLEKLYFRDPNQGHIAVVGGPSALTTNQKRSTFICAVLGLVLSALLVAAFSIWMSASSAAAVIAVALFLLIKIPAIRNLMASLKILRRQLNEYVGGNNEQMSDFVYHDLDTFQISYPTRYTSWILFAFEIIFLFFFPLISLLILGNQPFAILFFVMGIISGLRIYFSPSTIIKGLGKLDEFLDEDNDEGIGSDLRDQSRMNTILENISDGQIAGFWMKTFGGFALVFILLVLGASQSLGLGASTIEPFESFGYSRNKEQFYPACSMDTSMIVPGLENTALVDYTFLSGLAYVEESNTQDLLNKWFNSYDSLGPKAFDEKNTVKEFKDTQLSDEERLSSVSYKLIKFSLPSGEDHFVVAIRGTNNAWDALADLQLWSAAWITQQFRWFVPYGSIFNYIFECVVNFTGTIENVSLESVAYYKQTTKFVEWLSSEKKYEKIYITGHSLGGGLAIITGTQTKHEAVAISGPNAMLSRETFNPPLSAKDLNMYTFNVIPGKDPVPRIDDVAQNYQKIRCTASPSRFIDCHTLDRTLCEVLYTCGSHGRLVPKSCAEIYNYDAPSA